jgi:hypothetical protein
MDDDFSKLHEIVGETVFDPQGHVIGKVAQIAYGPDMFHPEWLVLKTSRLGRQQRLVPIEAVRDEGRTIWVPFPKDVVMAAPVPVVPSTPAGSEAVALQAHYRAAA